MGDVMKVTYTYKALALFALTICVTRVCGAQIQSSNFTQSCSEQIDASVDRDASWLTHYDAQSPNALKVSVADRSFSELTMKGLELLSDANGARKSSFSPTARRRAERILREELTTSSYQTLVPLSFDDSILNATEHFCISDTCLPFASCKAVNLTSNVRKMVKDLPNQARLYKKIIRWAGESRMSRSEIQALREVYTKNLRVFRNAAAELEGKTVYVENGFVLKD